MLALLISTLAARSFQVEPVPKAPNDFLISQDRAYVIGPPSVISERPITQLHWSASGTTLAYQERSPVPVRDWVKRLTGGQAVEAEPSNFVIRDLRSGRTFRRPYAPTKFASEISFIGQTNRLLIQDFGLIDGEPTTVRHTVMNPDGIQSEIAFTGKTDILAVTNPVRPEYYLVNGFDRTPPRSEVVAVDSSGRRIPLGTFTGYFSGCSPDGKTLIFSVFDSARRVMVKTELDRDTKKVTVTETEFKKRVGGKSDPSAFKAIVEDDDEESGREPKPFRLSLEPTKHPRQYRISLAIENETEPSPPGNISNSGELLGMSPTGSFIAYVSDGVTFLREILPIDAKSLRVALAEQAKADAISRAKQAALALILLSTDYDDELPKPSENWRDRAYPYTKERSTLERFTYTFPGGNIAKVEKPDQTVLGYISIDGGRAVAFVDGSVKWVPKS
ncbi:MAG: hypothetical protein SFX74_04265 [Fimbriimonadaceae bacterium]|nr:hypothetical protein [Fimbriimonadaceae bacterium]